MMLHRLDMLNAFSTSNISTYNGLSGHNPILSQERTVNETGKQQKSKHNNKFSNSSLKSTNIIIDYFSAFMLTEHLCSKYKHLNTFFKITCIDMCNS